MMCFPADSSAPERYCPVRPDGLTLYRAFELRGIHANCANDPECLVYLTCQGYIEDYHDHEPLYTGPPFDGGEPGDTEPPPYVDLVA